MSARKFKQGSHVLLTGQDFGPRPRFRARRCPAWRAPWVHIFDEQLRAILSRSPRVLGWHRNGTGRVEEYAGVVRRLIKKKDRRDRTYRYEVEISTPWGTERVRAKEDCLRPDPNYDPRPARKKRCSCVVLDCDPFAPPSGRSRDAAIRERLRNEGRGCQLSGRANSL